METDLHVADLKTKYTHTKTKVTAEELAAVIVGLKVNGGVNFYKFQILEWVNINP